MEEQEKRIQEINKQIDILAKKLGRGAYKVFEVGDLREAQAVLTGLRSDLSDIEGSATNLYARLKGVTSEFEGQETATQGIRKAFRSITADATKLKNDEQEISKLSTKELSNLQKRLKVNQAKIQEDSQALIGSNRLAGKLNEIVQSEIARGATVDEINDKVSKHLSRINTLSSEQKAMLANYFDQNNVVGDLLDKTEKRLAAEQKIDKQVAGFSALSSLAKGIPGLSALAGPFQDAEKAARETAAAKGSALEIFAAGSKAILKAFGPITIIVSSIKFLKDAAFAIDEKQTSIAKSMSLSVTESKAMYTQFKGIKESSDNVLATTKNLIKAQGSLGSAMGATRGFTAQQLEDQVKLVNNMGLEEATAGRLQALSMSRGQSADASVKSIISATQALKTQTGIQLDQKGVIDEVAKTEGQLAANYGNNPGLIAKAVTQVRKLGLSLSQANKMASSMLDFESSLANEMEAEVLLGRDLNLDRARALALQGDAAGAAAEIRKQVGSLADFQNLNVIQQEALAKAAGMTADELANSLMAEENLSKLGSQTRKQIEERVKQLKAEGRVAEANRLLSQAANEEDAAAALERLTAQQEFQAALDRAKEAFAEVFDANFDIAGVARSIASIFSGLAKNLKLIKGIAIGVASVMAMTLTRSIGIAIANLFGGQGKIPFVGIAAAVAGVATMMSLISKNKKADDMISPGSGSGGYGNRTLFGPEGAISLNNKDTVIAGTNLGGNTGRSDSGMSAKLMDKIDKLISIVEKGGDVYMDGSKVGEALVLSSKLST